MRIALIKDGNTPDSGVSESIQALGATVTVYPDAESLVAAETNRQETLVASHAAAASGSGNGSFAATPVTNGAAGLDANSAPSDSLCCVVFAHPLEAVLSSRLIDTIRDTKPGLPMIAACPRPTVEQATEAMRRGLSDVLIVDQPADSLSASLQKVLAASSRIATLAGERIELQSRMKRLTDAEDEVLEAMLAGLANKQIAQSLQIGLRTVELRRSKIMRKMQAKSLAELVKFVCIARGIGQIETLTAAY
ncbi:MAG: LuxR C-terminal-related transcriptional regulator [Planctomycetota bacterium]